MSSSEIVANRRFSGKKSFSLTCSRLSQYLKENGGFGDLNLGIACKSDVVTNGNIGMSRQPTTTMSLFPCEAAATQQEARPMTLFPRQASFSSSSTSAPKEDVLKTTTTTKSVKPEAQTAPLTIFYGGQVLVFNDFSAEKAKEVMNLASKGSANSFTGFTSNVNNNIQPVYVPNNIVKNQTEIFRSNNNIAPIPHLRKSATPEPIQPLATPLTCELPIARRASLHRFLEKRKDRVTSKAPYQLCDPAKASSKHQTGDNKTSWLGLAAEM